MKANFAVGILLFVGTVFGQNNTMLCHNPGPNQVTITVNQSSVVQAHLNHGDVLGSCEHVDNGDNGGDGDNTDIVLVPGPQGPTGPQGPKGDSGDSAELHPMLRSVHFDLIGNDAFVTIGKDVHKVEAIRVYFLLPDNTERRVAIQSTMTKPGEVFKPPVPIELSVQGEQFSVVMKKLVPPYVPRRYPQDYSFVLSFGQLDGAVLFHVVMDYWDKGGN